MSGPIAFVAGTRPELIKLAKMIRLLGDRGCFIHTGQHWDRTLHGDLIDDLGLRDPDHQLAVGGRSRAGQIAEAMLGLEALFAEVRPAAVVVQGDTNTVTAGALCANAMEIPVVHVEAGLRSYDRRMPEEHNRVVTDHLSDLCLAPTTASAAHLVAEGIADDRIVITGNTVVDAVVDLLPPPDERVALLAQHGLSPNGFVLSTFHRPENVDDAERLRWVLTMLADLPVPVFLPLHPRARQRAVDFGLEPLLGELLVVDPIAYRPFLGLLAECALAISDSGGVQEEISVVKRPGIVVRRSTERPEVIGTFSMLVEPGPEVGQAARRVLADIGELHAGLAGIPSPYGEGDAAERSLAAIDALLF